MRKFALLASLFLVCVLEGGAQVERPREVKMGVQYLYKTECWDCPNIRVIHLWPQNVCLLGWNTGHSVEVEEIPCPWEIKK